jgi:hypothetical protein
VKNNKATDAAVRRALLRLLNGWRLTVVEIRYITVFVNDPDSGLTGDEQDAIQDGLDACGGEDDE